SRARARVWIDASLPTSRFGTIALDSGSLTLAPALRWSFIDDERAGLGVLLGYRAGRRNSTPRFGSMNDGSERLRGLPDVAGAADAGFEAHAAVLGVPLFAQLRSALRGVQGSTVNLGAYVPLNLGGGAVLTILPTLTWSDARQARAFYSINAEDAAASRFAP